MAKKRNQDPSEIANAILTGDLEKVAIQIGLSYMNLIRTCRIGKIRTEKFI